MTEEAAPDKLVVEPDEPPVTEQRDPSMSPIAEDKIEPGSSLLTFSSPTTSTKEVVDPTKAPSSGSLSLTSKFYDAGSKGYLTAAERKMREMDTSNRGQLTNAQVVQVVEQTMAIREANIRLRNLVIGLFVAVVVLGLANVGVALAAARLAKDTETDSGTGEMKVKGSNVRVVTQGRGGSLTVRAHVYGDEVVYCTSTEDMARLYNTNRHGVAVSLVLENSIDDTTWALDIDRGGAFFNSTAVVLRASDGSPLLFDITSSVCDEIFGFSPQGNRYLGEDHQNLRYKKFLRHLDEDNILGEEIVEAVLASSPTVQAPTPRKLYEYYFPELDLPPGGGAPDYNPCQGYACQTRFVPPGQQKKKKKKFV